MTALLALLLAMASAPQESAQRLRSGQEKLKVRDFDGAIPEFERCLQLQPEEYNACFGLGVCHWEKDEYKKARDQFSKVVELVEKENPGAPLPGVHQKLLGCALLLEDFDAAIAEASHLIRLQPTAEYFYDRALAHHRKGDAKGALADCANALREDSLLTKARTLRAYALLTQSDMEGALLEYATAIKMKPSDREGFLGRACALYRLERWRESLDDLKMARKANRGQGSDLEDQAYTTAMTWIVQARLGQKPAGDEAKTFRATLVELGKDPAKNHLLCLPLYLAGDFSEAQLLQAAESAAARKSQARGEACFFIAERRLLDGDKAGAREYFKKCAAAGARGNFEYDLALLRLIVLGD